MTYLEKTDAFFAKHLQDVPVVLILRNLPPKDSRELARMAWDFGVHLVEVPIASSHAWESFEAVLDESQGENEVVGAGSVTTTEQAARCVSDGAQFLVSPGFSEALSEFTARQGVPWLPGVATGSEIMAAQNRGLTWLKAFPAGQLGSGWIKAQLGPFPGVKFVATGGVSADNAKDWVSAGAHALGVGGGAANTKALEALVKALDR